MVIFGGYDGTNVYNDVWELTLPASGDGTWTQLSPTGYPPSKRRSISAAYDSVNDRMIIFGGRDINYFFGDTWALSLGASPAWTNLQPQVMVPVSVAVTGLTAGTSYHWQAWVTDSGGDSTKVSYGGNLESAADFTVIPEKLLVFLFLGPLLPNLIRKFRKKRYNKRQKIKTRWRN